MTVGSGGLHIMISSWSDCMTTPGNCGNQMRTWTNPCGHQHNVWETNKNYWLQSIALRSRQTLSDLQKCHWITLWNNIRFASKHRNAQSPEFSVCMSAPPDRWSPFESCMIDQFLDSLYDHPQTVEHLWSPPVSSIGPLLNQPYWNLAMKTSTGCHWLQNANAINHDYMLITPIDHIHAAFAERLSWTEIETYHRSLALCTLWWKSANEKWQNKLTKNKTIYLHLNKVRLSSSLWVWCT